MQPAAHHARIAEQRGAERALPESAEEMQLGRARVQRPDAMREDDPPAVLAVPTSGSEPNGPSARRQSRIWSSSIRSDCADSPTRAYNR